MTKNVLHQITWKQWLTLLILNKVISQTDSKTNLEHLTTIKAIHKHKINRN